MSDPIYPQVKQRLIQGCQAMGLVPTEQQCHQFLLYLQQFMQWGRVYNLSTVLDPQAVVDRHWLDSLALVAMIPEGYSVLDLGSGGGLPGIPLAIMRPDLHLTLLDANGKKTRFLTQVVYELGLPSVQVVCERADAHQPDQRYDVMVSRAFASIATIMTYATSLLSEAGIVLMLKGQYPHEEIAELPVSPDVAPLVLPGQSGERHCVAMPMQRWLSQADKP